MIGKCVHSRIVVRTGYLILVWIRRSMSNNYFCRKCWSMESALFGSAHRAKPSTPTVGGEYDGGIKGYYFDSGNARCYWYT